MSPLHHKAVKEQELTRIRRINGSTQLQHLAVRNFIVFNSTPSGNKLVGVHNRMGMQFARKSKGMLVVKSQLFKLVKVVLSITCPTNAQDNGV
eukprot:1143386-Pelagomonas_calceolata.AAC.2